MNCKATSVAFVAVGVWKTSDSINAHHETKKVSTENQSVEKYNRSTQKIQSDATFSTFLLLQKPRRQWASAILTIFAQFTRFTGLARVPVDARSPVYARLARRSLRAGVAVHAVLTPQAGRARRSILAGVALITRQTRRVAYGRHARRAAFAWYAVATQFPRLTFGALDARQAVAAIIAVDARNPGAPGCPGNPRCPGGQRLHPSCDRMIKSWRTIPGAPLLPGLPGIPGGPSTPGRPASPAGPGGQ
uniref:Uncharacterized protein n=1 Tax=Romanomermis culicivorax TaxID=13658 RepID=A0A915KG83_ROMCU